MRRRKLAVTRCRFSRSFDKALGMVADLRAKSCRKSIAITGVACAFGSYSSRSERSMTSDSFEGSAMRSRGRRPNHLQCAVPQCTV